MASWCGREKRSGSPRRPTARFMRWSSCSRKNSPGHSEGREALRFRAARVAGGLEHAARLVDLRTGDESFGPVRRDVDVVAAAAQLLNDLTAKARFYPDSVG